MSEYIEWLENDDEESLSEQEIEISPNTMQQFTFDRAETVTPKPVDILSLATIQQEQQRKQAKEKKRQKKTLKKNPLPPQKIVLPEEQYWQTLTEEMVESIEADYALKMMNRGHINFTPEQTQFIVSSGVAAVIASFLMCSQVQSLCNVNKNFYRAFGSDLIWKHFFVKRWHREYAVYSKKRHCYKVLFMREYMKHRIWAYKQEVMLDDLPVSDGYEHTYQLTSIHNFSDESPAILDEVVKASCVYYPLLKDCWNCRSKDVRIVQLTADSCAMYCTTCKILHQFEVWQPMFSLFD